MENMLNGNFATENFLQPQKAKTGLDIWSPLTLHHILRSVCASAQVGLQSGAGSGPVLAGLKERWWSPAGAPQQRTWRKQEA